MILQFPPKAAILSLLLQIVKFLNFGLFSIKMTQESYKLDKILEVEDRIYNDELKQIVSSQFSWFNTSR